MTGRWQLQPSWRDRDDAPTQAPQPQGASNGPGSDSHYVAIGDFQGADYRRNAFALHTDVEVDALERMLALPPGAGVLDVGCGNGRHLLELARRGHRGLGLELSPVLVEVASASAREEGLGVDFLAVDARDFLDGDPPLGPDREPAPIFDAAIALHHGAFGTNPATDGAVLAGMGRHVRPGGRVVVTAFHALCAVRNLAPGDAYDTVNGVHHQVSEVHGPDGERRRFDFWTAAYTARELALLAATAGLDVEWIQGCQPGRYTPSSTVALDDPELLMVASVR